METHEVHYGKLVTQLTVRKLHAFVQASSREIRKRLDLGLLSL
jgi:hypothetical protein